MGMELRIGDYWYATVDTGRHGEKEERRVILGGRAIHMLLERTGTVSLGSLPFSVLASQHPFLRMCSTLSQYVYHRWERREEFPQCPQCPQCRNLTSGTGEDLSLAQKCCPGLIMG